MDGPGTVVVVVVVVVVAAAAVAVEKVVAYQGEAESSRVHQS